MDYQSCIDEIYSEVKPLLGLGQVAGYIPVLAKVNPNQLGIAVQTLDGQSFQAGDALTPFSIQSISKVFVFSMIFHAFGDKLWNRMGREPSGNSFNSLVQLENESGIPRNPFINAGALVSTDCLLSISKNPLEEILNFVRSLAGNQNINFDNAVAASERDTGYRNAALANFMKSFGNIKNEISEVLHTYFHQCALAMSCVDLARAFSFLANGGVNPFNNEQILTLSQAKRVNALMQTCGLYNESGEFAFCAGLPGKSGVGGGIVAVLPKHLSICVWSPELNKHGNSLIGMKALELFTTKTGISIF
ncbi:MAG TPA: glutaminase [Candidatus Rifleibacterium sp.]|nr:glutaminase [Candidatus Rifleibacterium sp.]HPT46391.1 glutaminase [Candidatus Rifleibacterium sp.]